MDISLVIQAGGESRRMGRDKALLPFHGQQLITRVISRLQGLSQEVIITSNSPELLDFLNFPIYGDIIKEHGALGGLHTAFSMAKYSIVAVVACDMPFVNATLLLAQANLLDDLKLDGVVPHHLNGYEPFHAVYRRVPCLDAVTNAINQGRKRADCWYPDVRMGFIEQEQISRNDPDGRAFLNINTEDEYQYSLSLDEK